MRKVVGAICITLFIIFCILICTGKVHNLDDKSFEIMSTIMSEPLTGFFIFITHVGGEIFVIVLLAILCVKLKNKDMLKAIVLNLILIIILNQSLKFVIQRERPSVNQLVKVSGYSFPSGHTMISVAFYGYLIHLIYRNVKDKKMKIIGCTSLTILIILVSISRVYLGVHYMSDILAGTFVSLAYLKLYTEFIENYKRRKAL